MFILELIGVIATVLSLLLTIFLSRKQIASALREGETSSINLGEDSCVNVVAKSIIAITGSAFVSLWLFAVLIRPYFSELSVSDISRGSGIFLVLGLLFGGGILRKQSWIIIFTVLGGVTFLSAFFSFGLFFIISLF